MRSDCFELDVMPVYGDVCKSEWFTCGTVLVNPGSPLSPTRDVIATYTEFGRGSVNQGPTLQCYQAGGQCAKYEVQYCVSSNMQLKSRC